jgi:hypothetical protein
MTSAVDRLLPGYEPDFDIDYAIGKQGELYVANIADAISAGDGSIEVKTDELALKTKRIYVEYECLRFGNWEPSGIATTCADFWAFVIGSDTVIVMPTWRLKALARVYFRQEFFRKSCERGSHPTHGVVIPLENILLKLFEDNA